MSDASKQFHPDSLDSLMTPKQSVRVRAALNCSRTNFLMSTCVHDLAGVYIAGHVGVTAGAFPDHVVTLEYCAVTASGPETYPLYLRNEISSVVRYKRPHARISLRAISSLYSLSFSSSSENCVNPPTKGPICR